MSSYVSLPLEDSKMRRGVWVLVLAALGLLVGPSLAHKKYNITVGYLPCITGPLRHRQGLTISGALSLALEELNNRTDILPDVEILLEWHDTKFDTSTTTRLIDDMSSAGVVAFFGPEGRCHNESVKAQTKNIPMIAYRCSDYQNLTLPNFALLEPPAAQATKSVTALLRYYRWNKFSIIYEESWEKVAKTLENQAEQNNMTVTFKKPVIDPFKCCEERMACCSSDSWYRIIQETKNKTRIYVFLGSTSALIEMMTAMDVHQLFSNGDYMVIFIDMVTYSSQDSLKYIIKTEDRGLLCPRIDQIKKRAQSLLVVTSSEPSRDYQAFIDKVRRYNSLPPFNFTNVFGSKYNKFVSLYAAYLYDSAYLYAKALDEIIKEETKYEPLTHEKLLDISSNGSNIISKMIKSSPYKSVSGMLISLDEQAYSEGNFSVLAFKPRNGIDRKTECDYSMMPVGNFLYRCNNSPLYKLNPQIPIDWPDNVKPEDEPSCGFNNEKCPRDDSQITSLVVAGTLAVTLMVLFLGVLATIYRMKNSTAHTQNETLKSSMLK